MIHDPLNFHLQINVGDIDSWRNGGRLRDRGHVQNTTPDHARQIVGRTEALQRRNDRPRTREAGMGQKDGLPSERAGTGAARKERSQTERDRDENKAQQKTPPEIPTEQDFQRGKGLRHGNFGRGNGTSRMMMMIDFIQTH